MTSTNVFQGLDNSAKPSSRVLRPPGGGSSNLFGGFEEDCAPTRRSNKMASTIFSPADEPREAAVRRSNPPGGKTSGIFGDEAPAQQPRHIPPGGPSSNIFGAAEPGQAQSPSRSHPNKPKDHFSVKPEPELPVAPQPKVSPAEVKEEPVSPPPASPAKLEAAVPPATPEPAPQSATSFPDDDFRKNHEPHLGPKPRSHNRVLNPPGGKSSVVFY